MAELATWTVHREYLTTVPELYTGTHEFTAGHKGSRDCSSAAASLLGGKHTAGGSAAGPDSYLGPLSLNADCPDAVKLGLNSFVL